MKVRIRQFLGDLAEKFWMLPGLDGAGGRHFGDGSGSY